MTHFTTLLREAGDPGEVHKPAAAHRERIERDCMTLSSRQYGLISRRQAKILGLSDRSIGRRLASGKLVLARPGVYRHPAVAPSWHQLVLAECLTNRAVASHRSALKLLGVEGYDESIVEVTTIRDKRASSGRVIRHHTSSLPPDDIQRAGPIPVTTPTRTILDIGAVLGEAAVETALDSALRQRLTSLAELCRRLDQLGSSGRPGTAKIRKLLSEREPGAVPTDSPLETLISRLLSENGLPSPERQFSIYDGGVFVARVDFAYPSLKIAIEGQSYRWHSGRAAWQADMERWNRLQELGWIVILVSWSEVTSGPHEVAGRVAKALALRDEGFRR